MPQPSYRTILRYYWLQMRKHRGYFALVFVGYGVGVILADIINPLWYRRIIDTVTTSYDPRGAWQDLLRTLIYIGITMASYNVAFRIGDAAISRFQSRTMKDLADFAFANLIKHSYRFFSNTFAGSLVTKVKRFIRAFEDAHDQIAFVFWFTGVQLVGIFIALLIIAPFIALFFFCWIVVYIPLAIYLTRKKIPFDLQESTSDSKVTGRLSDVITNILNIKMFSSRHREIADFGAVTEQERFARHRAWIFGNRIWLIQSVLLTSLEFLGMSFSLYLWREGAISAGTIVLVQIYIAAMWHNLWNISKSLGKISKNFADASELVEIFETPLDIKDLKHPEPLRISQGEIEFDRVSFRYGKKTNRVFNDFSLHIPRGQRIGFVGHSGAGKSTITKLILRFSDIQHGVITIDGQDITRVAQDALRNMIAYVPQDPILFHRSLYENISYGQPDATGDEIIEASKKAHAHEFISRFPQGYETLVGERGIKLSGGERQRVAIARAMLKNAPILILDEATSSLDAISEKYIQEAFQELMNGRTTIVIAHRLSTIQNLDRIVVLKEGRIIEDGSHEDLIALNGVYFELWQHQAGGFIK